MLGRRVLVALAALAAATSCGGPGESPPQVVRVGVLPDQSPEELRRRYEPLVDRLASRTGLELELEIPGDYDELLEWFDTGRVQLAWFGGLTFLHAERRSGAAPLVMRDVDLEFTTDFIVAASDERDLDELEGATMAFGPPKSTSGHLMPRFDLVRLGIDPESYFDDLRYSTGHDETVGWVRDGAVDLGAVNSVVVFAMQRDGRLPAGAVRVVRTTPPFRNYVWAVRPDVAASTRRVLLGGFLGLRHGDPAEREMLERLGVERGFVPASTADYDELRQAARVLGAIP